MRPLHSKQLSRSQSGINMVDLMMWLVIAALLLATAIQGIGYYQKAARLNTLKSDAAGIGTNALARAALNGTELDRTALDQGAAETKLSTDVTYETFSAGSEQKPYAVLTHPNIADTKVLYLFDSCGDYSAGVHSIPSEYTPVLEACGVDGTVDSAGSGGTTPAVFSWGKCDAYPLIVNTYNAYRTLYTDPIYAEFRAIGQRGEDYMPYYNANSVHLNEVSSAYTASTQAVKADSVQYAKLNEVTNIASGSAGNTAILQPYLDTKNAAYSVWMATPTADNFITWYEKDIDMIVAKCNLLTS